MSEPRILSHLKSQREQAGLSQLALAERVGVSRQAVIAIEAGRQVPSTSLALQLARVLGCSVDDLFQLMPGEGIEAAVAPVPGPGDDSPGAAPPGCRRVAMGRLRGRWVAHPLADDACSAADGLVVSESGGRGDERARGGRARGGRPAAGWATGNRAIAGTAIAGRAIASKAMIEPLAELADIERNVLVAGCAPLLGVLAQRAGLRYRDARMTWLPANSAHALALLDAGLVHVAGLHLVDGRSGEDNTRVLRERFAGRSMLVVNLTRWRQGFVVRHGNPLGIRVPGDLLRPGIRFAHREPGAGASALVGRLMAAAGDARAAVPPGPVAAGHVEVAQLVRCGAADAGIAIESVALAAGLGFVPLSEERFDLVLPPELASQAPVARILELLGDRWFRAEAARIPGYDDSLSGQVTALGAA